MGVHSILVLLRASKWQTKWRPPGVGGGAAHIPERGDGGPLLLPRGALPGTQHAAPSLAAHAGNGDPQIMGCPSLLLYLPPPGTLPAAPQSPLLSELGHRTVWHSLGRYR